LLLFLRLIFNKNSQIEKKKQALMPTVNLNLYPRSSHFTYLSEVVRELHPPNADGSSSDNIFATDFKGDGECFDDISVV